MIDTILLFAFLGTFLEGEMTLIGLTLYIQTQGYSLGLFMLLAWLGSALWDQGSFLLVRYLFSKQQWMKKIQKYTAIQELNIYLDTHMNSFIFSFRFIPGLRTIGPVALGLNSKVSIIKYGVLNLMSSFLWVFLICGSTYWIGESLGHYAITALTFLILCIFLLKIFFYIRHRMRSKTDNQLQEKDDDEEI